MWQIPVDRINIEALALVAKRADADLMRQAPRPRDESLYARGLWQHILWGRCLIGATTLALQARGWHGASPRWQTMAFCVLTFAQQGLDPAVRSERRSLFGLGLFTNLTLLAAVGLTVVLQFTVVCLPAAQSIFKTQPMNAMEMLACMGAGLAVMLAVELAKWLRRRRSG